MTCNVVLLRDPYGNPSGYATDRPRPHRTEAQGGSAARGRAAEGRVDRSAAPHRRLDAADHLVGRPGRPRRLLQPPLVRAARRRGPGRRRTDRRLAAARCIRTTGSPRTICGWPRCGPARRSRWSTGSDRRRRRLPLVSRRGRCRCSTSAAPWSGGTARAPTSTIARWPSPSSPRAAPGCAAALDASVTGTFRWDIATNVLESDSNLDRLFGLAAGACGALARGVLPAGAP